MYLHESIDFIKYTTGSTMAFLARCRIYTKNLTFLRFQLFVLTFIFFLSISSVFAADYWPNDKWRTATPESQGMSSEILADMMDILWRKNLEIDSILIVRNGYVVLDTYHFPKALDFKHNIF